MSRKYREHRGDKYKGDGSMRSGCLDAYEKPSETPTAPFEPDKRHWMVTCPWCDTEQEGKTKWKSQAMDWPCPTCDCVGCGKPFIMPKTWSRKPVRVQKLPHGLEARLEAK